MALPEEMVFPEALQLGQLPLPKVPATLALKVTGSAAALITPTSNIAARNRAPSAMNFLTVNMYLRPPIEPSASASSLPIDEAK